MDFILEPNQYTLYFGHAWYTTFKPIITNGRSKEIRSKYIEPNEIPPRSNPAYARFEEKEYSIRDFVTDIGGYVSAITYLIFGATKQQPWGLAQNYIFTCSLCKRSLKRSVARKYVSSAGIPLVERIDKRPEGSFLEKRLQIVEDLLQEYYIDTSLLEKVRLCHEHNHEIIAEL
ncbi:hypothetical protein C1645_810759 [Glomus cerebriforme]|uniref:Uncharacterized protein n=1 Tax=Glomus cerebriforme TaxID=658196 RepID=A0A397RZ26_9GLOM|nr:hypothetical protein C1645_810759 [Glomus cerebriforme]